MVLFWLTEFFELMSFYGNLFYAQNFRDISIAQRFIYINLGNLGRSWIK